MILQLGWLDKGCPHVVGDPYPQGIHLNGSCYKVCPEVVCLLGGRKKGIGRGYKSEKTLVDSFCGQVQNPSYEQAEVKTLKQNSKELR